MKTLDAFFSPNSPLSWCRASRGLVSTAVLLCVLFPLPGLSDATNCRENYNRSVADLERGYSETVNSMRKTARLNNLDIAKDLREMSRAHSKALEQARQFYNECAARADEQERERRKAKDRADEERREAKERADKNNARQIENQVNQLRNNSSVQQFNSQPLDAQRKSLLNSDPSAFKGQADQLEEKARDLSDRSTKALLNGDHATFRALSSAASELNSEASNARSLATRATMEQNSEKSRIESDARKVESDRYWAAQSAKRKADHEAQMKRLREPPVVRAYDASPSIPQTYTVSPSGAAQARRTFRDEVSDNAPDAIFDGVRDGIEEDTGLRTHVPGERIVTKPLEYIKDAQKRADQVSPLGNPVADTIKKKVLPQIMKHLNNPNAEPRRSDPSRGYPSGINPPSSGGGSRTPYNPPAALPHFASPSVSQPITEQDVKRDFDILKSRHGAPASSPQPNRIPLLPMPPEPRPNPNPPPAASPEPTVFGIFKKMFDDLGRPDPTPTPTPQPIKPVDLLEPRSK